ncbi:MAG TPA: B12-binding domain-containing radical SAM protein [bacterium]|nr:B12-binding domain-containing radical SAM protein [bacterium]
MREPGRKSHISIAGSAVERLSAANGCRRQRQTAECLLHIMLKRVENRPVVLIYPPVAKPCEPPAGIARLHGALQDEQIPCVCIDANLEAQLHLLQQPIDSHHKRLHQAVHNRSANLAALRSLSSYGRIDSYRRIVGEIDYLLQQHGKTVQAAAGLANYVQLGRRPTRSADLRWAAENPQQNLFYSYYVDKLIPRLQALQPELVGLSISFHNQALCAFALIGLLRRHMPQVPIYLGGGLVNSWLHTQSKPALFTDLVDLCVAGPGETPLLQRFGIAAKSELSDHSEYSGLYCTDYLAPTFILPFAVSMGCYWHRCRFCPERAEGNPYLALDAKTARNELERLIELWHPGLVHFLDNALPIDFSVELAANPISVPWYGYVRLEPQLLDAGFCRDLAAAGCVMLKIGFESGNQQVLRRMQKGIRLEQSEKILRNLRDAGIKIYGYVLFGTPHESLVEARETLAFLRRNSEMIDFVNAAIFSLPSGSPDSRFVSTRPFSEGDLSLYRDFSHPHGWDRRAIRQFLQQEMRSDGTLRKIFNREPSIFTANHAPFFGLAETGGAAIATPQS